MSFNQPRSDKSDSHHRKSGRSTSFNQQRGSSGAHVKGGGGPAPSPSITSGPSLSSNRSFKKPNNAQGVQSTVNQPFLGSTESNSASGPRTVQNGSHVQPQLHGKSDAPVTNATAKSTESSAVQRSDRIVPKTSTSQPSPVSSDIAAPTTPAKAQGDASKAFALQFGSISPGLMNGMVIPARTSSAPPNLDEQKRDRAQHDAFRPVPSMPTPPVPKQQHPRKDVPVVDQSHAGEAHSGARAKKESLVSPLPPANQMQKPSVVPVTGLSMAKPYHQSQTSVQFGGPNPQIQSQGMSATSLPMPMPMPLPIGNAPQVQQPVFVPGLQPHPMHPQGIMQQGQNMSFTTQMGPQLPHQLGNMGISINPQYPQQQGAKFGGQRKTTVKITHPETHEELRLDKRMDAYSDDGSAGARSYPNVPSQSQPVQSYAASHPINYYPTSSYNTNSLFFPSPSSHPLTSSQIIPNSQPSRFNYPVNHGQQNVGFMNPSSLGSLPDSKMGIPMSNQDRSHDVHIVISSAPSGITSVTIKPSGGSGVVDSSSVSTIVCGVEKNESYSSSGLAGDARSSLPQKGSETCSDVSSLQSQTSADSSASESFAKQSTSVSAEGPATIQLMPDSTVEIEDSVSVVSKYEGKKESLSSSDSLKDYQKTSEKKGQSLHQVAAQSPAMGGMPSQAVEKAIYDDGVVKTTETKGNYSATIISDFPATPDALLTSSSGVPDAVEVETNFSVQGVAHISAEEPGMQAAHHLNDHKDDKLEESSQQDKHLKMNIPIVGAVDERSFRGPKPNIRGGGSSVESLSTESKQIEKDAANVSNKALPLSTALQGQGESMNCSEEGDRVDDKFGMSTSSSVDPKHVYPCKNDIGVSKEVVYTNSGTSGKQPASDLEATLKYGKDSSDNAGSSATYKEKSFLVKTSSRGKKKRREILQKADAAGSSSDLYNAYKGPEENKEAVGSLENAESAFTPGIFKEWTTDPAQPDARASEKGGQSKAEPDDWEDAADMSTPKLEVADKMKQVDDGSGSTTKKYSRDFLLKFAEQCNDLPEGFEITADIAEALMGTNISSHIERDSHPSPGRIIDRPGGASRIDRRGSGVNEEERWSKGFGSGRLDAGFGGNSGFRLGQVSNSGVLRNPRAQTPVSYAGGILSGPMQSMGSQGGMQRINADGERWQRAASLQQRGLIPSPQTPVQMMHKAEKKYEVGKVTDEEEAKQRQLKAILNKLTPQNFEKLFEQVKAVKIDNAVTLTGVISQIFEKALMEPTFCEMYANFCWYLASVLPDFKEHEQKITFKRLLLNKCQEEFERGEREEEEANKADEGEVKQSAHEREEKRTKARRRMLGNIRLIGELYKKKMLTERIMHECIKKLLGQHQDPDEEDIEALCKLMSTIGEMIDHPKAKDHIDAYFDLMTSLSNNMNLSSRVRFMLKDTIDLRKNKWQQKRKVEGPKKIEEVHRDAAQERNLAGRLGRGPGNNPPTRRMPIDIGRGSVLSSPNAQMGGLRGMPNPTWGYGSQDVRVEDRQSYEARTFSVPLPQRPLGDDSITLGPQGGLARGMSIRGPAVIPSPVSDVNPVLGDSRRMTTAPNGHSNLSERGPYSPRDDLTPRYMSDRFTGPASYDQSSVQERNMTYGDRDFRNADRTFDRPVPTSPSQVQGPTVSQAASLEKVWPEERLQDMSLAAIKEFYSARDEKEVALCVKDLNSPSFHPTMVSIWVTDSFERKDTERDLLAKLLINLAKSHDGTLSQAQLIKGFESVLTALEDAVNDAPRAPDFLAGIFAKVITENVVSLKEIGKLIYEGGEEPGLLLEVGLAADVLGSTLEIIKLDKGDAYLSEILASSNLWLETFRPPHPIISNKLEKFI